MSGTTDKIKGSLKEAVGKVTGDKDAVREGKADKVKGHFNDSAHEVKEAAKRGSRK